VNRIENLENEFVAIAKEYFMTMMNDTSKGTNSSTKASDTKVRKVTIE
jgi:hypothetical protein